MYLNGQTKLGQNRSTPNSFIEREKAHRDEVPPKIEYVADYNPKMQIVN